MRKILMLLAVSSLLAFAACGGGAGGEGGSSGSTSNSLFPSDVSTDMKY